VTTYSYSQLEGLWINAGGPRAVAPVMAAIAEAESGGNSDAYNGHDTNGQGGTQVSAGLWQISNGTMTPVPNWSDPGANARDAVAKYKAGGFSPWGTYTSGAYRAYLQNSTTPDTNVPGSPTAQASAAAAASSADCLISNPVGGGVLGFLTGAPACLFSKSNARAFIGAGLLLAGGVITLAGLAVLAASAGVRAAGPVGKAAEGVGSALLLVPGAEGVGAGLVAAGHESQKVGKEGAAKRLQARQQRRGKAEDKRQKQFGEPRENPDLEVGGGTVRESAAQRSARRRREQGAGRARARRAAGSSPGGPASREETGF